MEDTRKHAKKMEAKENGWSAEIKKSNARFEKEKNEKFQAMAKDALTKAREGLEERRIQLSVAKEQLKNENAKRGKVEKLYKSIKHDLIL